MYNKAAIKSYDKGRVFHEKGELSEAERAYKKAIKINSDFVEAYSNLGNVLVDRGRLKEATDAYKKALKLLPSHPMLLNNLGNALQLQGENEKAISWLNEAIANDPNYADAYSNLGNALKDLGNLEEAVNSYRRAIRIDSSLAEAYLNLGFALKELGKFEEAMECLNKAIELKPDLAEAYAALCEIYEKQNMVTELKNALQQAQEALPANDPGLLYFMAQLASLEKRFEDAHDFLELIAPEKFPPNMRQVHSELLAKTYDKLGQFSNAFAQFEITNKITKQSSDARKFSAQRYFDRISQLSESWSNVARIKWPVRQAPANQHSLAFLVGFPRSGTTLLDTILRSHPEIYVVEEEPMVEAMRIHVEGLASFNLLDSLDDNQIEELSEVYFKELYSHVKLDSSHKLIIDKLPLNITQAGLIHRIFPESKFILALRHPCDCVLSCFMQNFELNDAMANFLTLQQSARLYDAVISLWVHYSNTLDLEVGILKYEDLVLDLQGTVEPLLNFLGLDWHDNLLSYQQTALLRGKINTPSYNQVTQSLYTQASGRWTNYRDQMKEVIPLLEPWAEKFGYSTEL